MIIDDLIQLYSAESSHCSGHTCLSMHGAGAARSASLTMFESGCPSFSECRAGKSCSTWKAPTAPSCHTCWSPVPQKSQKPKKHPETKVHLSWSFHIVSHGFTSFLYNYVILIIFCVDLENCSHGKDDTFDSKEARKFTSRDMWHLLRQAAKEQCDSHLLTFARQGEADIRVLELSACDDCAENIWTLEHLQVFALCAWQSVSWVRRSFRRVCDEHFVTKVEQKSLCLCLSLSQFVLVWQTMKEDSADTKETQRTLMDFKYLYNIAKEDRFVSASCRRRKRSPGLAQPLQKSQGYDNWGASAHGTICES